MAANQNVMIGGAPLGGNTFNWINDDGFEEVMPSRSDYDELKDEIADIKEHIILIDRDNCLEADYKELKAAYDAYEELRDKLRTFKALKDSA
jgi:hypothetical protein